MAKKVERLFLIQVISYDWNCAQYITPRFTATEVETYVAPLKARIAELEAQLAEVKKSGVAGVQELQNETPVLRSADVD